MMKNRFIAALTILAVIMLSACHQSAEPKLSSKPNSAAASMEPTYQTTETIGTATAETTVAETTVAETSAATPAHSHLYIPDISVEDVILSFNEVCLDSEFVNSGDPSYVQKWTEPIYYTLAGEYDDSDVALLNSFADWLNSIKGFPGIFSTEDPAKTNLQIYFCDQQEIPVRMGPEFTNVDGGVRFWYIANEIYDAIICYRADMSQPLRNSVILEEIYNALGPVQDTSLRPDSIIYQEYSEPQQLSPVDELILRLLYHPDIRPGMNAEECGQVIRDLYY